MSKSLVIVTLILTLAITTLAQNRTGFGSRGGAALFQPAGETSLNDLTEPALRVRQALNLTPVQFEAVRALLTLRADAIRTVQEDIRVRQQSLALLRSQPNADPTELGSAMQALQAAQQNVQSIHEEFVLDFEALLNSEQTKTLSVIRDAAERIQVLAGVGLIDGFAAPGPRVPRF
jgi:hypothetical protein